MSPVMALSVIGMRVYRDGNGLYICIDGGGMVIYGCKGEIGHGGSRLSFLDERRICVILFFFHLYRCLRSVERERQTERERFHLILSFSSLFSASLYLAFLRFLSFFWFFCLVMVLYFRRGLIVHM